MAIKQIYLYSIFFLILISILPILSATTILPYGFVNDTVITSTGLNLTINITQPLTFGAIVETNYIYIENLQSSGCVLSFNITEVNKNYTGQDLPYCSKIDSNNYQVISNLTNAINVSISFTSPYAGDINSITVGNGTKSYTFNNPNPGALVPTAEISNFPVTKGTNNVSINYITGSAAGGGGGSIANIVDNVANKIDSTIKAVTDNQPQVIQFIGIVIIILLFIGLGYKLYRG